MSLTMASATSITASTATTSSDATPARAVAPSRQGFFSRSELTRTLYDFRHEFLVAGLFSMVINLLMLTPTIYMLQVYDRVMVSQSELTLLAMSLLALFLFSVMALSEWARSRWLVRAGTRMDERLSTRVFNANFEANLSPLGGGASRAFSDLTQIRQFLTGNGIFAFFDTPWVPIYMGVLFLLHPLLGVVGCAFAVIQGALAWFGHRNALAPTQEAGNAANAANAYLQSKLRNVEVLESMGMLGNLARRWERLHATYLSRTASSQELMHRITAFSKFVRYSQQSMSLGVGALLVIDGQLSAGGMIAANVLMTRALAPIDMLVGTWRAYLSARESFGRLETLLETYPDTATVHQGQVPSGKLVLSDVVATATARTQPILEQVSLEITPGTVTVVLGPSGSGKSTLGRVMTGIWPQTTGEVSLDGVPLAEWGRTELGPYLGYLPQDVELFDGSIAENIARFSEIDSEKIIAAAKATGLHDMILRLPKGYDTQIGEAGGLLSGGQRQRIGLARAMYGDPALVVLDEPNANLDDMGEAALAQAVLHLKSKGSSVVVISHRTSILGVADRVVVLRDGRIQFNGPKDQVLREMAQPVQAGGNGDPALASK